MSNHNADSILVSILELLREQAIHIDLIGHWTVAIADTLVKQPELAAPLRENPFCNLGPQPQLRKLDEMLQHIEGLIHQLEDRRCSSV
jgi:hypothetical protein